MKENYLKKNQGITLIALVITIIVLLILAGVTIAMVVRDDGIMSKAKKAKNDTVNGQKEDLNDLDLMDQYIEEEQLGQIPIVLRIASDATGNITLPIKEDCQVDWNYVFENNSKYEGNFVDVISNSTYINYHYEDNLAKDRTIAIKGNVTEISRDYLYNWSDETSIKEVLSWGTTGLTKIDLHTCGNLFKIASPNVKSFENVTTFYNQDNDYGSFEECNNLTEIPEKLFVNCPNTTNFSKIFWNTGIKSIPENLFANCPNATDFSYAFYNTGITGIPENLFANCPNATDFSYAFYNTGITGIPENLFANCPNVTNFSDIFSNTRITGIPENLFANCPNVTDFSCTFSDTDITSIPENLFAKCPNVTDFYATFRNTQITSIPENLFANCSKVTTFTKTFRNTQIISIPENLFANCLNVKYFRFTFAKCAKLSGTPLNLWKRVTTDTKTYIGDPDGEGCYWDAGKEPTYRAEVPEYWKKYEQSAPR